MSWSAAQYVKFEEERTRPVRDLVSRIPNPDARRAADIGCGPGNSTEVLRQRYPTAAISRRGQFVRHDRCRAQTAARGLPLKSPTSSAGRGEGFDVILANAVIQWIPDHAALHAGAGRQACAGRLARRPDARQPRRAVAPADARDRPPTDPGRPSSQTPRKRARRATAPTGISGCCGRQAPRVDVWRTTYFHPLAGARAVVEWLKGTGLRPFLDPLDPAEREAYLARYVAEIAKAYPAEADGTVLLPFPRLFFVATR